jgi:DNA-binding NarL/FixJ family response regulator
VMDLQMPHVDGVTATRQIAEALPDVRVLALTMFEDDDSGLSAMRAGAQGYLVEGADSPDVERAITAVARRGDLRPWCRRGGANDLTRPLSARSGLTGLAPSSPQRSLLRDGRRFVRVEVGVCGPVEGVWVAGVAAA